MRTAPSGLTFEVTDTVPPTKSAVTSPERIEDMKKLTRFLALFVCAAIMLALSACSPGEKIAVNISGAEIDYETFLYFLDTVKNSPEDYGLDEKPSASALKKAAVECCKEYVAVNTWLEDEELTLSPSEKSAASDNLNNTWRVFSHYYEELGVSKQTLMKIKTSDANRDRLFYFVYDEGGEKAVAETDIKKYYDENYISFRAISVYLNTTDEDGKSAAMTDAEKAAVKTELDSLAQRLKNGQTMDSVVDAYSAQHPDSTVSGQLQFIKKDANSYPDGFFDKVKALSVGSSEVMIFDEYAFLVLRENLKEDDAQQYYIRYRDDCLKSLKGDEFDLLVKEYAAKLNAETDEKVVKKALREVGIDV